MTLSREPRASSVPRNRRATLVLAVLVAGASLGGKCSTAGPAPVSMEDELREIYDKRAYRLKTFGPARWLDGSRSFTTLEPSPDTKAVEGAKEANDAKTEKDIVAYD